MTQNPYRDLPSVDALADELPGHLPRPLVVSAAREAIDIARARLYEGSTVDVRELAEQMVREAERASGTAVINATGVLLHTNLGRAVWPESAIERAAYAARHHTNVEMDLETGARGRRGGHVEALLREATGAEAALVVNNNAAALLLSLAATSSGRSVPVARGELIEIGGSYRLPEVMTASGARLIEIGTTNRTRLGDYVTALQTHDCGAILKVHPSNYTIEGFTTEPTVAELAGLSDPDTPLVYDLGSGLLDSSASWLPVWMSGEPGVRQSIEAGADVVMFSGDKLLGGPQAGILVGNAGLIDRLRSNPLARALRVDSTIYAALGATLDAYVRGKPDEIPFWRQALTPATDLLARCSRLAGAVGGEVEDGASVVGAGSAPGIAIPGPIVRLKGAQHLFEALLRRERPILCRRDSGDLLVDLRAVVETEDQVVADAILQCR